MFVFNHKKNKNKTLICVKNIIALLEILQRRHSDFRKLKESAADF